MEQKNTVINIKLTTKRKVKEARSAAITTEKVNGSYPLNLPMNSTTNKIRHTRRYINSQDELQDTSILTKTIWNNSNPYQIEARRYYTKI